MKKLTLAFALLGAGVPATAADVTGYIVDSACSTKKEMFDNADCVARCARRGNPLVVATEDGKVYKIANQDKVKSDSYGKKVTVSGKIEGETITIDNLKM